MNDQHGTAGPGPAAQAGVPEATSPAMPWERWFARMFDLWWEAMLVGLLAGYVLGQSSPGFLRWIDSPGAANFFGLLCIPFALLLDGAIQATVGNSPGKALLGLRVVQLDGSPLSFMQQVWRSLGVWTAGFGLAIPLITLFTMVRQYRRLKAGQQASYDDEGFRVESWPTSAGRRFAFGAGFVLLLMTVVGLGIADKEEQDASTRADGAPLTWTNPETGRTTRLSPQWTYTQQTNADGMLVHEFTQHTGHAVVVMASEGLGGVSLAQYARTLTGHLAPDWKVPGGYLEQFRGYPSWTGTGEHSKSEVRMQIRLVQEADRVWRVAIIQSPPMEYTDELALKLSGKLWDTVAPVSSGAAP